MKNIFLFLITLLSFYSAKSQDTIVKKSGEIVIAKVIEINPNEVKYKRFDFQEGPIYIEMKSNIDKIIYSNGVKEIFSSQPATQTNQVVITNNETPRDYYNRPIIASNKIEKWGLQYRYHNERLTERDLYEILNQTKDKKIVSMVAQAKEAKGMQYLGFLAIPFGVASGIFFLKSTGMFNTSYSNSNRNQYGLNNNDLVLSGIFLAGTITFPIISGVQKAKRNTYNHDAVKLYNEKF